MGRFRRFSSGSTIRRKDFTRRDLNAHVGSASREYEGLHGGYGSRESNAEDKTILDFSSALEFTKANASFRKQMQSVWVCWKWEIPLQERLAGLKQVGASRQIENGSFHWVLSRPDPTYIGLKKVIRLINQGRIGLDTRFHCHPYPCMLIHFSVV